VDDDNPKMDGIISNLANIQNWNDTVSLPTDALNWAEEVISYFNYYTYLGSLTTTPCSEVVTWIVLKKKMGISANQVNETNNK